MPIMFEIAAYAALIIGNDQTGVDPQVDKQYAIVKPGKPITPTEFTNEQTNREVDRSSDRSSNHSIVLYQQDGSVNTQGAPAKISDAPRAITAGQATAAQSGSIVLQGQQTTPSAPAAIAGPAQARSSYSLIAPDNHGLSAPVMSYYQMGGLSRMKGMDKPISVHFTNATAADVLKWLAKQNVNFVTNVDKMPKSKITVNLTHVPLHEALETVAESLGGSWQVNGSTLVFQTGRMSWSTAPMAVPGMRINSLGGDIFMDPKAFSNFDSKQFGELKSLKGLGGDMFVSPKGFAKMDPSQMKAFEKSMSDLNIHLKDMPKMDPSQMKAFEKSMTDMKLQMKKMPKIDAQMLEELKSLKGLGADEKTFNFKLDHNSKDMLKSFSKDGKTFSFGSGNSLFGKGFTFKKIDGAKFIKSISPAQRELMTKQGYLKFSDLTQEQRNMMFDGSTKSLPENFTFMFSADGEKVTIKNK